jgi:hypothetical protein
MVSKVIGYMVFEASEDFEQALRLLHGDALPAGGILDWREGRQPAALFPTRGDARDAITRTEYYRLAFGNNLLPERKFCKVVPVAMTQETPK